MSNNDGDGRRDAADAVTPVVIDEPDGTVLRLAPWSAWTREELSATADRPIRVTRLERGQLRFDAGRSRSLWRHEVVAGPALITTTDGTFQVIAEDDGGATVVGIAGRIKVTAGSREPVDLEAGHTAAISADGATLVVLDRAPGVDSRLADLTGRGVGQVIDLTDRAEKARTRRGDRASRSAVSAGQDQGPRRPDPELALARMVGRRSAEEGGEPAPAVPPSTPLRGEGPPEPPSDPPAEDWPEPEPEPSPRRRRLLAEIVAVAALVSVLVAAALVFSRTEDSPAEQVATGPSVSTTEAPAPSATATPATSNPGPASTSPATTAPATTAPATTAVTTPSTTPPATVPTVASNPSARAEGRLVRCRRAGTDAVTATVDVTQTGGGAAAFEVRVALVNSAGPFAQGTARSPRLDAGAAAVVEVTIAVPGGAEGTCELLAVQAI